MRKPCPSYFHPDPMSVEGRTSQSVLASSPLTLTAPLLLTDLNHHGPKHNSYTPSPRPQFSASFHNPPANHQNKHTHCQCSFLVQFSLLSPSHNHWGASIHLEIYIQLSDWDWENITQIFEFKHIGTSLAVQWLGLSTFTAVGPGSIPGQGTKIPQATGRGQKKFKIK